MATEKSGQEIFYEQATAAYGAAIDRLAQCYEADSEKRQDLLQEIHLALWRSFEGFDARCSLRTWVYRVAHNVAISHVIHRRRTNSRMLLSLEALEGISAKDDVEAEVDQHDVTQTVAIVSALAELILSFLLAILVAYSSFLFNRMTRDLDEINELKKNNIAAGILLASLLISSALIFREAIYPAVSALQTKLFAGIDLITGIVLFASTILYAAIAAVTSIAAIALSMTLFLRFTRDVDELAEISRNNVAVAITLGSVIIVTGIFLSHGVQSLLSAIIPDPAFGKIQLMGGPR